MGDRPGVVVGMDGWTGSRTALLFALDEAAWRGTGVRVVSALLPPECWPYAYELSAPPSIAEMKDDLRAVARRVVDHVVAGRPDLAAVGVELHEVAGRPAEVLIAQSRGADLLVVGHRGRGGIGSAVLGSVGLQCVLHAECPVAVVPAAQPAVEEKDAERVDGQFAIAGAGFGWDSVGPLY